MLFKRCSSELEVISYLSVPADAAHEPPEGDDLLHGDDVLEVDVGPGQVHALDGLGRLAGVLKEDDQLKIGDRRFAGGLRPA